MMTKKDFSKALHKIGFKRVVFERILPTPTLKKTQSNVLFTDESPIDFYPTVVVPNFFIGRTLFIIDNEALENLLEKLDCEEE